MVDSSIWRRMETSSDLDAAHETWLKPPVYFVDFTYTMHIVAQSTGPLLVFG